ncbi:hypothetical protein C1645_790875 [Glomus cerebriforme]|uniref:Uncharacterized protein n=1 Tax=Glomus cerebriforme TaxID=658196 RepID=A0A397S8S6_9GLOM|nr:hypothetical protein C1645_790875 [Glomus cerebriforme]
MVLIEPNLNEDDKRHILITYDESITEKAIPIFEKLHPDKISIFAFDNITSHTIYAKDALIVSKMNLKPGGKEKFKNGLIPDESI